jgi:hypothetical protein
MRCIDKSSRDEQEPERMNMGTYEELRKESTKERSGPFTMRK